MRIQIEGGATRPTVCPVCGEEQGKLSPQHMQTHGLTLDQAYGSFPGLGFTKKARLIIQPSPSGLLNTLKVHCLMVAGAGFGKAEPINSIAVFIDLAYRIKSGINLLEC